MKATPAAPTPAGGHALPRAAIALVVLVLLFVAGAYLYVHVGGHLLARARALPAPLMVGLAAVGGAASFFSPCSVAITPSFLAYLMPPQAGPRQDARTFVSPSVWVAFGIVSFYAGAGLLIGWIGAQIYNVLVYLIVLVGFVFLWLGYELLSGRPQLFGRLGAYNPVNRVYDDHVSRGEMRGPGQLYGFGCAYGAASHTCTLPLFLGVVLAPLAAGEPWLAGLATLVYGGAIAALLVIMAVLGGNVLAGLQRRLLGRTMQAGMGVLFVLTGGYLVYYFVQNFGGLL